jgi:hypothetical protein
VSAWGHVRRAACCPAPTAAPQASEPGALLRAANTLRSAGGRLDHLRGLRDLLDITLTPAAEAVTGAAAAGPGSAAAATAAVAAGSSVVSSTAGGGGGAGGGGCAVSPWVCPVTQLPAGRLPFAALRPCGHALSERALRPLAAAGELACPVCGVAADGPPLPLLGPPEVVERLRAAHAAQVAAEAAKGAARRGEGRKRKAAAASEVAASGEAEGWDGTGSAAAGRRRVLGGDFTG